MKRFLLVSAFAGLLVLAVAGSAFAAPLEQGFGPGNGIHTPGTALTQGTAPTGAAAGVGMRGGRPAWAGQPAEVGQLLGLTQEQIQAERQAGTSLAEIAGGKGIAKDKLVGTILNAKKAILDNLVASEKLTQAQADAILERMQAQVASNVDRTATGPAARQNGTVTATGRMGGARWSR